MTAWFVRFLLATGLRLNEALGVWESDISGDTLHLTEQKDRRKPMRVKLKTKNARRDIPLGPEAVAVIRELRAEKLRVGIR